MRFKSVTNSRKAGFPRHGWKASALATAMALTFGMASLDAHALALGRINVLSALGEPLRAEIDIPDINPEEASSLRATVARPETFRASGLEYNVIVSSVEVRLLKRPDGRSYLRLTSTRPVNDPFLDLILETQWSSGRIVRDYTMLFDPPNLRQQAAPAPTAPQVAPAAVARPLPSPPAAPAATIAPAATAPARPAAPTASARPPVVAPQSAAAPPPADSQVTVRSGDTAGRIAAANKTDSVSLDQMLVALQRSNPDAFISGNVNRIKAGAVLDIPTAAQAAATPADEASRIVIAQSKDFNEFRRRLAESATAAAGTEPNRQAGGKVQASVEDKKPAAAAPDKLTLSKGGVQAKATEAQIAASAQTREATDRAAELARNIGELAKLQGAPGVAGSTPALAASAAKQGGVNVVTGSPAVVAPAAVASAPAPAAEAAAPAAVASSATTTAEAAPAAAVVASAPVAEAPAPVVKARAPVPAPAPALEPSLLSEIMDNPMAPIAAGGLVALLAGFGFYRARQRKKPASVDSSFLESRLQPDSFFGASGGQHIDTKEAAATGSSMVYSPSQLDAAGDVDPVAEADVYLAYGRDLQAEEILKEAMRTTPGRVAIHGKLLEIYAKRRDIKAFEVVATEAYGLTQGQGLEWEQICEHGRDLDPDNPLYQPGGTPPVRAGAAVAVPTASGFHAHTVPVTGPAPLDSKSPPVDLDLDLDFSTSDQPDDESRLTPAAPPVAAFTPPPAAARAATPVTAALAPEFRVPAQSSGYGTIDLSMPDLPPLASTTEADSTQAPSDSGMMEFDLGSLSLDLDPTVGNGAKPDLAGTPASDDPLATKLALAEEFLSIGDDDGARALVEEVVAEASGGLKSKAEKLLAEIG
ncbi:FimV/HubP family polar landmark protein [Hydrogenophaga sp.]|uniref:FimV/HubP family polar landmark protein n=1 Tax=Hydrogenophaga sp. TaxID=1904254 RepID=UPI002ABC60DD|nr:FimV/HubP family polar landmark protein [Hydrogenophaga sp.]MDZ4143327.1 FimV/HubP family polar landmark protein [Burkholderiales bacterium]MDZ4398677.1 FimV/HubP family polar landmark protein [Hydrogenophaga sp.]